MSSVSWNVLRLYLNKLSKGTLVDTLVLVVKNLSGDDITNEKLDDFVHDVVTLIQAQLVLDGKSKLSNFGPDQQETIRKVIKTLTKGD